MHIRRKEIIALLHKSLSAHHTIFYSHRRRFLLELDVSFYLFLNFKKYNTRRGREQMPETFKGYFPVSCFGKRSRTENGTKAMHRPRNSLENRQVKYNTRRKKSIRQTDEDQYARYSMNLFAIFIDYALFAIFSSYDCLSIVIYDFSAQNRNKNKTILFSSEK